MQIEATATHVELNENSTCVECNKHLAGFLFSEAI